MEEPPRLNDQSLVHDVFNLFERISLVICMTKKKTIKTEIRYERSVTCTDRITQNCSLVAPIY